MPEQRGHFPAAVARVGAAEEAHAGQVLAIDNQREERHRPVDLLSGNQARQAAFGGGLGGREGQQGQVNVGVQVGVIGVGVVLVVFLDPPAEADAEEEVAEEQPDQGIGAAVGEHLAVAGIVDEEGELHADDTERERAEDEERWLAEAPDQGEGQREQGSGHKQLAEGVAGLGAQQPRRLDALLQITIIVGHERSFCVVVLSLRGRRRGRPAPPSPRDQVEAHRDQLILLRQLPMVRAAEQRRPERVVQFFVAQPGGMDFHPQFVLGQHRRAAT